MQFKEESQSFLNNDLFVDKSLTSNLRLSFVRKVYAIITVQLSVTAALCYLSRSVQGVGMFVKQTHPIALIALIVSSLWLSLSKTASKEVPKNYILLSVFTLSEAISLSSMIFYVDAQIITSAFFLTAGMTIGLTVYALTTKKDFTMMGATFFIFLSALSLLGLLQFFVRSHFIMNLYLIGGTILYGFYLIYDTQLIMGGKNRKVSIDDYVMGAVIIYTDIIQLFIKLVKLLQELNEKENNKKK